MVNKLTTWTFKCDKCGLVSISLDSGETTILLQLKKLGWSFNQTQYSSNESTSIESCKDFLCPDCVEEKRLKDFNSEDMYERIRAGYYTKYPDKFNEDILAYIGVPINHPKADILLSIACDMSHSGGYSEMLSSADQLAPLLK